MQRPNLRLIGLGGLTLATGIAASIAAQPQSLPGSLTRETDQGPRGWTTAVDPKPLSEHAIAGLDWLVAHQHDSGGWGQGEESARMGQGMSGLVSPPNVADTCAAVLALIRSGSTPSHGSYAGAIHKGLEYVCREIAASDEDSLSVTSVHGTRVQAKLGPNIDTFLAAVVLAEAKGHMPDEASEKHLVSCLNKVLHKLEKNQQSDGSWDKRGWAPVLAQSMANKGLARARQVGLEVDEEVLKRSEAGAREQVVGAGSGGAFAAPGSAGVALYSGAAQLSTLQDSVNSNKQREDEVRDLAEHAPEESTRLEARAELKRFAEAEAALTNVKQAIAGRIGDEQFMAGFGSNGGEEFLSYMNIGEALVVEGGDEWTTWDKRITKNLDRIQNADGSWTGHHCITGRTFCTASALLVLMVDRTPVPIEAVKANR